MRENLYINDTTNIDAVQAPSLPPWGKVAPQGRMRGGYVGELSVNGQLRQVAPHPSAGRAADTFPLGGEGSLRKQNRRLRGLQPTGGGILYNPYFL